MNARSDHATQRFSNRVADYVRARPSYPSAVIDLLQRAVGTGAVVADVGSGTGILTAQLLAAGHVVHAVEPNAAMRGAAEARLAREAGFHSHDGTAEATALAPASVDLVVAAQAFHWFDRAAFRRECLRILRPGGRVALVWNDRLTGGTPFLDGYERLLLRHGVDYVAVNHRNISDADLAAFFAPGAMAKHVVPSAQRFDHDGLAARLLSSSYTPPADDPRAGPMLAALRTLFDATSAGGQVEMRYDTLVYLGALQA